MNFALTLILFFLSIEPGHTQEASRDAFNSRRFEQLSGKKASKDEKVFWDRKYSKTQYVFGKTPATFLADNYMYLPQGGTVLDVGMGEGRNAVFLARKGFKVTGIDISSVAVKKAKLLAKEFDVRIKSVVASLNKYDFKPGSFDAILCFYYVDRNLNKKLVKWLKPGGVLIYESYNDRQRTLKGHEHHNPKYLLREGELLKMFPGLRVLKFEEPLHKEAFTSSIIIQKS